MRDDWIPRLKADLEPVSLDLDHAAGFLLSRVDGATSVRDLRVLTGLPQGQVAAILERLEGLGALEQNDGQGGLEQRAASGDSGAQSWRRIFERDLHPLGLDARVDRAGHASDEILRALCFDPSHRVIAVLLENERFGLEHARLVARHHRSSQGLDALGARALLLRDPQVERHLFRNPQTSLHLLRRIFARAHMAKIYRLAVGHDATGQVRETAKRHFRKAFTAGTAEQRVKLILDTEGRCLALVVGLSLDAKAAALMRQRALTSALLVRNLARWPATPPPLLAHLMRQPQVKRNPGLRNLVLRHPNAPSELKRDA